jgi:hypothetical protein
LRLPPLHVVSFLSKLRLGPALQRDQGAARLPVPPSSWNAQGVSRFGAAIAATPAPARSCGADNPSLRPDNAHRPRRLVDPLARADETLPACDAPASGITGGLQWGSATDGNRIFVAVANSGTALSPGTGKPWTLKNQTTTVSGGWAALNRSSGAVLWTTPDPDGSRSEAAVSGANGVVFGCSLFGRMVAMDANTGAILWSYLSGYPCNAGPSISDGMVYWGSGTFAGNGAKKLFAFGL